MKKLFAVDGNSILNRAFFGIRPLTTKDGFPTNALYGFVNMITKQADQLDPDYCAVAFDLKAPTFRHKMYEKYKAGRKPMPPELWQQFPVAKEILTALGYHILELEGYEADDILGTLAAMCDDADVEAYLMTGDRDSLQLIDDHVHVLLATNTETVDMDEAKFFEKYGVKSSQFVDVKALMGDSSDNIPGVPGIGEKTALKLIADFGSLDGVYEQLPTATHTPSVRAKLESGKDSAYLSQTLARICRTAPLGVTLDGLTSGDVDRAELRRLFLRFEFTGFLKKFGLTDADPSPVAAASDPDTPAPQTSDISVTEPTDAELLSALRDAELIGFDSDGERLYFCVGNNVFQTSSALSAFLSVLQNKTVVCYDCKPFYKQTLTDGVRELKLFDLMLGAYLSDSSRASFDLSTLVSSFLNEIPNESVPRVAVYPRLYAPILESLNATGQLSLLETLEMPLAEVLADMESAGFRVDLEGIARYGEQLSAVASDLEQRIWFEAGTEFNINSPKQLGEVLFERLKLPYAKKTKTGYSTNAEILEKLRPYHEIVDDILYYRQVTKLKSTYVDGLIKVADEGGRVHTNFKQTGTATGRLSSTEPNLQNIPVRTELGRELRRYFLPEPDHVIIDADYSQIELRLLAHISGDANMIGAFRSGVDIHASTAARVFGVAPENVTGEMRKKAKAVNFGILYGIGAFSLSGDIGTSVAQAQAYIDQYLAGYPGIDAYLKKTIQDAYANGNVTTLFGRRRVIPELSGSNKVLQKFGERVAMNSPIQGTAADVIKLAMIRVHHRLRDAGIDARLILQVHDELLIESNKSCAAEAEQILREEMEHAVEYSVPLDVDIHTAETWYDAK